MAQPQKKPPEAPEQTIIRNGVPYALSVRKLIDKWPVQSLTEQQLIPHGELEAVIETPAKTGRYYGIVNSWISRMKREYGTFMVWEPGGGVRVLDPSNVLGHAEKRTRQKIKQTGRAIGIFRHVDRTRLNETGQARLDHQVRTFALLRDAMAAAKKETSIDLAPVVSLPKRVS